MVWVKWYGCVFVLILSSVFSPLFSIENNVLVLHSYNQGYIWTDNITTGISDFFNEKDDVTIDYEYLDSREYSGKKYDRVFLGYLHEKYRENKPEILIVSDNPALEFIVRYGDELFGEIPVVFCGINNYNESMLKGKTNMTGVVEEVSMRETLELVFRLHPHARKLYVAVPGDITGKANLALLYSILSNLQSRFQLTVINDSYLADATEKINKISSEDILLFMAIYKNNKGELMSIAKSTSMALSNCAAPVYSFWEMYLGYGIIGGKLVSGINQGNVAASMAWKILNGEDIAKIPVIWKSPNRFSFDDRALRRFGIGMGLLPIDSLIINKPVPVLFRYWYLFALLSAVFIIMTWLLFTYALKQRKVGNFLSELNEFQQGVFESIPNAVYYKDMKLRYLGCNKAFEELFGISRNQLVGKTASDIFNKEKFELFESKDRELIRTRRNQIFQTEMSRSDGSQRMVVSIKSLIYQSGHEPVGILGIIMDLTEQKLVEENLKRAIERTELLAQELEGSRNFLDRIINSISDPVFVKDSAHRWILLNDAYCEFMGYRREELLGKTDSDFFPKEEADVFYEKDEVLLGLQEENMNEEEFTDRNGVIHTILTKKSLYVDGKKNKFIVGIISDITERKKLETELKIMNQGLGERVWEEVNKNREKDLILIKQSRQAAMGEMIRNIAHQWRQPLNALGITVQNIRERQKFGKLDEGYVDQAVKKSVDLIQFMSKTIDDFRDFFKSDREMTLFSVKDALFRAISIVEASMKNNLIELEFHLEKDVSAIGYPNEYSQVVLNILSNAKDELMANVVAKPRVRVTLREELGRSELLIWNNGGVIPDEIIGRVFDPYFTTKEGGTGIGLYMSKMIVEKNMNGKISVRNLDGGVEFRVLL